MEGIVCRPVMREPKALRKSLTCDTTRPISTPTSRADAKPAKALRMVTWTAVQNSGVLTSWKRVGSTRSGPGRTNSERHPDHTRACQASSTRTAAVTLGQVAAQILPASSAALLLSVPCRGCSSRASSPCTCRLSRTPGSGMAQDLLAQSIGDTCGLLGDRGRIDTPGSLPVDGELLDDPAWPVGQQHDPVAQAHGLTHVSGVEEDRQPFLPPDPFQLVVEDVAGHGIECAEWFVHEQDVGVLAQGSGQGHTLSHATGEFVGAFALETGQADQIQE